VGNGKEGGGARRTLAALLDFADAQLIVGMIRVSRLQKAKLGVALFRLANAVLKLGPVARHKVGRLVHNIYAHVCVRACVCEGKAQHAAARTQRSHTREKTLRASVRACGPPHTHAHTRAVGRSCTWRLWHVLRTSGGG
jgi:hypothetical protein